MMPKRLVPTRARPPRQTHHSALVSPLVSSINRTRPTANAACEIALFHTPTESIVNILDNRHDASIYSHAKLAWMQSHDIQRFKSCNFTNSYKSGKIYVKYTALQDRHDIIYINLR